MTLQFHSWANSEKNMIQKDTCTPVFIAALFTITKTWKQPKHPWIKNGQECMVHIYNGIPPSHYKDWNNAICSNMDGPSECHTERSKSAREGEISYDTPYMWNLKRNDTNEHTKQKEIHRLRKQAHGCQGEGIVTVSLRQCYESATWSLFYSPVK